MPGDFDTTILSQTAHRPWPLPGRPWVMTQTWHDLLFAHWPVEREELAFLVPRAFSIDTFDGLAWIGVVPFYMTNVAPRGVPAVPLVSEFAELNVRTYVRVGDRPGVYFFSLDAASSTAVWAARMLTNLPYHRATMRIETSRAHITYASRRGAAGSPSAKLAVRYRPIGTAFTPDPGSFEHFLTERYCLYNLDRHGRPQRLEIHHPPWQLHLAHVDLIENTMGEANGIRLRGDPRALHFAKRQDMVAWMPARL